MVTPYYYYYTGIYKYFTMSLSQPVSIPHYDVIQQELRQYAKILFEKQTENTGFHSSPRHELYASCPALFAWLDCCNQVWGEATCFYWFYTGPNYELPIHIDGRLENPSVFALNIPVEGCDRSEMLWYDNVDLVELRTNSGYPTEKLGIFDSPVKEIIDRITLDRPMIVRTDVPHNVTNFKETRRIIFSIRFAEQTLERWFGFCQST
jgi:hypothetical protein